MFKTLSPWVGQEVGDCSVQEEAGGAEGSPAQESHWGCRSLREGDGRRGGGEGGGTGGWEELDHQVTVYCFLEKLVGGFHVLKGAWARSYKCASCFVLIRKSPVPISPTSSLPGQNALGSPASHPKAVLDVLRFPVSGLPLALVSGRRMGPRGGVALGPLGSLHCHKSQINGLWCGIQQALSSDHSHSHGLHRPSSGPVPHLQTPVMPALQTLQEAA